MGDLSRFSTFYRSAPVGGSVYSDMRLQAHLLGSIYIMRLVVCCLDLTVINPRVETVT